MERINKNKMERINKNKIILMVFLTSMMVISIVSAIGVSGINSPLRLFPGEEREMSLYLSNVEIEDGMKIEGVLNKGNEIASFDKSVYDVAFESINSKAKLSIKIPESAEIGTTYDIAYEFSQAPSIGGDSQGTGASFVTGVKSGFVVQVVEKPVVEEAPAPEGGTKWLLWIIAIVVVLVLLYFIFLRKKKVVSGSVPVK